MGPYRISAFAARTGVPASTLRYYEREGLVRADRASNGYRSYTETDVDRVRFLGTAKALGLSLPQIRELLAVWDGGACRQVRDELQPLITAQVSAADRRIADLVAFREHLREALAHLRDLPPRDGPCDPGCEFLHDRVAATPTPSPAPPPVAPAGCSLGSEEFTERAARWRRVLVGASRERTDGGIRVRIAHQHATELTALVSAERECCPFLTLAVAADRSGLELTVHGPGGPTGLFGDLFDALSGGTEPETARSAGGSRINTARSAGGSPVDTVAPC